MADFNKAVNKVLLHEGGYVNHPDDRGGATNWGITQKVYEEFVGRSVSELEMKLMPKGNAIAIYKEKYWDKIQGDKIKSFAIAYAIFDQAVNRGVSAAVKQAQRVAGVSADGVLGPNTLKAINDMNEKTFIDKYLDLSEEAYRSIVENNPSQLVFLKGWLNRVESVRQFALDNLTVIGISLGAIATLGAIAFMAYQLSKQNKLKTA